MLATLALGGGSYAQGNGALLVALNKRHFRRVTRCGSPHVHGDRSARRVDAYVVVQLPNESLFSLQLEERWFRASSRLREVSSVSIYGVSGGGRFQWRRACGPLHVAVCPDRTRDA